MGGCEPSRLVAGCRGVSRLGDGSAVVGAMSGGGVLAGPPGIGGLPFVSWSSFVSLHRLARATRRGKLSSSAMRVDPARAALTFWLYELALFPEEAAVGFAFLCLGHAPVTEPGWFVCICVMLVALYRWWYSAWV